MNAYIQECSVEKSKEIQNRLKWYNKDQVIHYKEYWPDEAEPKGWIRLEDYGKQQHDLEITFEKMINGISDIIDGISKETSDIVNNMQRVPIWDIFRKKKNKFCVTE